MTPKIYVCQVEAMDGWSHVKSEPCSTLTFILHMTFHTLPLFSLPLKIYVSYMHIKIM